VSAVRRFSEAYGGFVSDHPYVMVGVVALIYLVAAYGNTLIQNVSMNQKDMLPGDDPAVKSLNAMQDELGGTESALFVLELDPTQTGSNEVKDIRDPRVLEYADILTQKAQKLDDAVSASSAADMIRREDRLSRSDNTINSLLSQNPQSTMYVSPDYSMTLVRIQLTDSINEDRLNRQLTGIVEETPKPPGIKAQVSGSVIVGSSIKAQIAPDMAKTGTYSLIGVIILVLITFGLSVRHSFTSLLAIILGSVWSFGLMGLMGMNITSQTSAGLSMILGIGIDFGIQVVNRFRIEARRMKVRQAMIETIDTVLVPMSTTTLAALIGFRAMSLGELTMLADLATMMSFGVLCCMAAALTVVPVALVIGEKYFGQFRWGFAYTLIKGKTIFGGKI